MSIESPPDMDELRAAVRRACQPTFVPHIIEGRNRVAGLPREWVVEQIDAVGTAVLDLSDYWEYGRFLEALDLIEAATLLLRLVDEGLSSDNTDVREMAELWAARLA